MSPERRAYIDAKKREIMAEVRLHELRTARHYSQVTIAQAMGVPQSAVSKIERRADAYVSTVRRYLEAMGASLHIVAEFPDGTKTEIGQFTDIGDVEEARDQIEEPVRA